jgi:uncharacterized protein GlcG (DUF336 family)
MTMTLEEARGSADKAIAKAREMGVQISLAVVDEFGQLVQMDRMDGASLMSPDIAEAKAVTALNFRRATSLVAQQINPDILRSLQASVHFNILAAAGGVPIYRDGELAGAIGVSGATGEQDEEAASAGAE